MKRIKLFEEFNEGTETPGGDMHANDVIVYLKEILEKYQDKKKAGDWTIEGDKGYRDELGDERKTTIFRNDTRNIDIDVTWIDTLKKGRFGPDETTGYAGDFDTEAEIDEITLFLGGGEEEYPVVPNEEMDRLFFEIQDKLSR
jgi:hypothetical protein